MARRRRKRNPKGKPWYWAERDGWYITLPTGRERIEDTDGNPVRGEDSRHLANELWEATKVFRRSVTPSTQTRAALQLRDLFEVFLQHCKKRPIPLGEISLGKYHHTLTDFLARHPNLSCQELTIQHVYQWWEKRPDWSPSTQTYNASILLAALNWGASSRSGWLIQQNPLKGIKLPGIASRGASQVVSKTSHADFLQVVPDYLRDVLITLYETGTRPINLTRITAQQVDLANRVWILNQHKTAKKTGRHLLVPLTNVVIEICKRLMEKYPEGPIFRNRKGKPWTDTKLPRAIRYWSGKLPKRVILYGYRHRKATELLEGGVPDATVAAILGQTNTNTLHRHYSHLGSNAKHLVGVLEQFSQSKELVS